MTLGLLLLLLLFGLAPPIMEEMAAVSAAGKFGSAVMALTVSVSETCWLGCNKDGVGAWELLGPTS